MVASILSLVSGKNALLCFPSVQHLRQAQTFSSFLTLAGRAIAEI